MTPTERFWSRVDKTGECWLWTGPLEALGYARFSVGGRKVYVHRYAYELTVGPIPDGREIDHLCTWIVKSEIGRGNYLDAENTGSVASRVEHVVRQANYAQAGGWKAAQ